MTTMAATGGTAEYTVTKAPYPARTKTASAVIHAIDTCVTSVDFADKILVTITQHGRLAHWVGISRVHCMHCTAHGR